MSTHQSIAELAYRLWVARGQPHGSAEEDWLAAERQLARSDENGVDSSLEDTFPASDAPASRLPDEPPANASDKWATTSLPVDETDDAPAAAPGNIGEDP